MQATRFIFNCLSVTLNPNLNGSKRTPLVVKSKNDSISRDLMQEFPHNTRDCKNPQPSHPASHRTHRAPLYDCIETIDKVSSSQRIL
ncbi:hypothetical protein AAY473_038844 [Plecturocebus cupreus]